MKNIDLSVIIPVYNTEKYFEKCIESVLLAIKKANITSEIIVINDGSLGNINELITKYLNCEKNIIYIKQQNKGRGATRNLGINTSKGSYISFIDSDDFVDENFYIKMFKQIKDKKADVVICDIKNIDYDNKEKESYLKAKTDGIDSIKWGIFNELILPSCCNKLIKKELFENLKFPEHINYEDLATIPAVILKAKCLSYLNEGLYKYVKNEDSVMHEKFGVNQLKLIDALEIICERIEKLNLDEDDIKKAKYITYAKRFYQELLEKIALSQDKKELVKIFCDKIKNIDNEFWNNKFFVNLINSQKVLKKYGNIFLHKAIQNKQYKIINFFLKEKIFYRFIFINNMSIGENKNEG